MTHEILAGSKSYMDILCGRYLCFKKPQKIKKIIRHEDYSWNESTYFNEAFEIGPPVLAWQTSKGEKSKNMFWVQKIRAKNS